MDKKEELYMAIVLIGISILVGGLLNRHISGFLITSRIIITSYNWIMIVGFIITFVGLIFLFLRIYNIGQKRIIKANILDVILVIILLVSSASIGGYF